MLFILMIGDEEMSEQILTTKEACTYLGVSYWTLIHKLVKEIPHIRIGKRGNIRFRKSTLDKYLDEQEKKSEDNLEQDLTPNRREESIVELREKYNKTNKAKSIEEIMQTVRSMR